jgi:hypothetical protein
MNTASSDLSKHLQVLKDRLLHPTDYEKAFHYFIEEFGGDVKFIQMGQPQPLPMLTPIIDRIACAALGKTVKVDRLKLSSVPGHAFHHEAEVNITAGSALENCFKINRLIEEEMVYSESIGLQSHFVPNETITGSYEIVHPSDIYTLESFGNNKKYKSILNGWFEPICYPIEFSKYYGFNVSNDDPNLYEYVTSVTLCNPNTKFNVIGEYGSWDLCLASGGLFKLSSVFSQTPSIYFSMPMSPAILFTDGPDFTINTVLSQSTNNNCLPNSNINQIIQNYSISRAANLYNYGAPEIFSENQIDFLSNKIINTNGNILKEFWETDNLYLGISQTVNQIIAPANFISLSNLTSNPCIQSSNQTLLCELNSTYENKFKFYTGASSIPMNEPVNIEVSAVFESGFTINTCFSYTFTSELSTLSFVSVLPTGRLSNWIPNSSNYKIKIYSIN